MATPRKKIKIRDKEATKKRLIEMIGVILRENGYRMLKPSEIEKRLGRNRRQIYSYFVNMNNLIAVYLKQKDYWQTYFERSEQIEPGDGEGIRKSFVKMIQDHFLHFKDNLDMQSIVLWQLTESRSIFQELNLEREVEIEKRLKLTDEFFAGSKVDFRSVMAIILGGSYFLSLHSKMGIGTIAGRDIKNAADYLLFQQTIVQVIGWAWNAAQKNQKRQSKSSMIMN